MAKLDERAITAAEADRQCHPIARLCKKRLGELEPGQACAALVRLILIVFFSLIIIIFFAALLALLGRRIGIADWPEAPDFRLRKKRQYGSERIFIALSG